MLSRLEKVLNRGRPIDAIPEEEKGHFHYIESKKDYKLTKQFQEGVEEFPFVSFDLEGQNPPVLMLVGTLDTHCYAFPLKKEKQDWKNQLPEVLVETLENRKITLIGAAIEDDLNELRQRQIKPKAWMDLQTWVSSIPEKYFKRKYEAEKYGLGAMAYNTYLEDYKPISSKEYIRKYTNPPLKYKPMSEMEFKKRNGRLPTPDDELPIMWPWHKSERAMYGKWELKNMTRYKKAYIKADANTPFTFLAHQMKQRILDEEDDFRLGTNMSLTDGFREMVQFYIEKDLPNSPVTKKKKIKRTAQIQIKPLEMSVDDGDSTDEEVRNYRRKCREHSEKIQEEYDLENGITNDVMDWTHLLNSTEEGYKEVDLTGELLDEEIEVINVIERSDYSRTKMKIKKEVKEEPMDLEDPNVSSISLNNTTSMFRQSTPIRSLSQETPKKSNPDALREAQKDSSKNPTPDSSKNSTQDSSLKKSSGNKRKRIEPPSPNDSGFDERNARLSQTDKTRVGDYRGNQPNDKRLSPVYYNACSFCGDATGRHFRKNCPMKRKQVADHGGEENPKNWFIRLCDYPLCVANATHDTSCCNSLHWKCRRCLKRGHREFPHCRVLTHNQKADIFHEYKHLGFFTKTFAENPNFDYNC